MELQARNLTLKPGEEFYLDDVSFSMQNGRLYTVLGRTLAGKTTLLKTIAGLINPDRGSLLHNGRDIGAVPVWKRNIAMVYQQFINYPHLSVFDNVAFPLRQRKIPRADMAKRVEAALECVGLDGFQSRRIQALSGGQQQRVALARSLAKEADILLLDEPLVNLDYKLREQLRDEFRNIFSSRVASNSVLIYSSTDPLEAMQLGGDIIILDEGRILQQGPARDIYENPANIRVAEIANDPAMNIIPGEIADGRIVLNADIALAIPAHFKSLAAGKYIFGLRAGDITVAPRTGKGIGFEVELAEISGSETLLHVINGTVSLVGLLDSVRQYDIGSSVTLSLDAAKAYCFDAKGNLLASPYGGRG